MGKQHNSFKNDIDLLAEAYGAIGAQHTFQDFGNAQQAADHMSDEDGEEHGHDKTGGMSDEALLASVEKKGTAGDALLRAAHERIRQGESLTPHERDALARDQYGFHGEDNEDTTPIGDDPGEDTDEADTSHFKSYDKNIGAKAKAAGWNPDAN